MSRRSGAHTGQQLCRCPILTCFATGLPPTLRSRHIPSRQTQTRESSGPFTFSAAFKRDARWRSVRGQVVPRALSYLPCLHAGIATFLRQNAKASCCPCTSVVADDRTVDCTERRNPARLTYPCDNGRSVAIANRTSEICPLAQRAL